MHAGATAMAPRRLADFLAFTQRFRIGATALAVIWLVVISVLELTPESGKTGTLVLGTIFGLLSVTALMIPRAAAWWVRRAGYSIAGFYTVTLVLDTILVCATVPFTGGAISITFVYFYFLAVGNCYMFRGRQMLMANTFMSAAYVVTLLLIPEGPYEPKLLDWVDILLVRIPLIYVVSYYAHWLARRGDKALSEDQQKYMDTLQGFLNALEVRDGYTRQHSLNVARWAWAFARHLGLPEEQADLLLHAGELHDIGKIGIPDAILNKTGPMSSEERYRMQEHPRIGVHITQNLRWFSKAHLEVILHHHERWDGKGYPEKLAGTRIPFLARLTTLCDSFDAMTNDRPYRSGMPISQALGVIRQGRGVQFDPLLADRFLIFLDGLMEVLRRHATFDECRSGAWSGNHLRLLLVSKDRAVWAHLMLEGNEWRWLNSQPVEAPTADRVG